MSGCAVCNNSGLVNYTVAETEENLEHDRMAACLCERGQAKLAAVKSISACIPVSTLDELWPESVPKVELMSGRSWTQWGYSLYSSPYYRLWWRFFFRPRIPLTIAA